MRINRKDGRTLKTVRIETSSLHQLKVELDHHHVVDEPLSKGNSLAKQARTNFCAGGGTVGAQA